MNGLGFAALLLLVALPFFGKFLAGSPEVEEVERDDG